MNVMILRNLFDIFKNFFSLHISTDKMQNNKKNYTNN